MDFIKTGSRIMSLSIFDKKGHKWLFVDSFMILPKSLKKLTTDFNVKHKKKEMDYENIRNEKWEKYLKYDCIGLYEVMRKFEDIVNNFGCNLETTISRQALAMFQTTLKHRIPNYPKYEKFIRSGYYGGRCEIFKMHGENLNYYDINSLYPYCMMENEMPIGIPMRKHGKPPEDSIAFCEAKVKIPEDMYIPPLPIRMNGKLIFPVGKIKGVWDFEELKMAEEYGCEINYIKSLYFRKKDYIFRDHVTNWYKIKNETDRNSALYTIAKLILNSLYGKFGQRREGKKIIFKPQRDEFVGLTPLYEDYGIYEKDEISTSTHILPAISSHITALSRIELYKWMVSIDSSQINTYYCDTDSIITTEKLKTSTKLGGMKLEKKADEGIFLLPKLYILRTAEDFEIKIKGYDRAREKLNFKSYEKALYNDDYSDFLVSFKRFGLFSENIRRNKPILSMVERKKSIKTSYDKRIRTDNYDTIPIKY